MQEGLGTIPHVPLKVVSQSGSRGTVLRRDQAHGTGGHRDPHQPKQTQGFPKLARPCLDEASDRGRSCRGGRGSDKLDFEDCPDTRWIFECLTKGTEK